MTRPKILIVDDEIALFDMLNTALSDDNEIHHAVSGEEAIEVMRCLEADIILLDIRMGKGIDGYETCRRIRTDLDNSHVHIIFLSGLDREEDILAGYEVGGDDFVVKPFKLSTLLKKVDLAKKQITDIDKIRDELTDARSIMFNVMGITSELGQIIHFLTHSCTIFDNGELAKEISLIMKSWQLDCTVQIRQEEKVENFCLEGNVKPLEAKIIETVYQKARIYHIKDYAFFNHENITIFIKNMPRNNPEKYANFNDNIAMLAEGANSRLLLMQQAKNHSKEHEKLKHIASQLKYSIIELNNLHNDSKEHMSEALVQFNNDINSLVVELDIASDVSKNFIEKFSRIHIDLEQSEQSINVISEVIERLMELVLLPDQK